MPTLLCVPILVHDESAALADAHAAKLAGADLVELRIDPLFSGSDGARGNMDEAEVAAIIRLIAQAPLPCIVTCRSIIEGGSFDGDESARVSLYERLGTLEPRSHASGLGAQHPPRYLDFEFAAYSRSANIKHKINLAIDEPAHSRELRPGLILSMHDFQGRPGDLLRRLTFMREEPAARIVKVAFHARSLRDNLEVFDLLSENAGGKPMIALAMGQFGLPSRVLAPKFQAFLTFASLRPQGATAPGQPTVSQLVDTYRFRSIGPRTRVLGVVGWPIEHSLSPLIHNAGFETLSSESWHESDADLLDEFPGSDAVYLPLPIPPEYEHFKATLGAFIDHPKLDFAGCSVTLPHKQHLVRFARERSLEGDDCAWEIDELSSAAGAANTLVIERDRLGLAIRARVANTDAPAVAELLRGALQAQGKLLTGSTIAIVGAGGVARAAAAGLLKACAHVIIMSRRREASESLAHDLEPLSKGRLEVADLQDLKSRHVDAVINATPVGMLAGPAPDESPIDIADLRDLSPNAVIMDTVYTPIHTPLLTQALAAEHPIIDGVQMFVHQAGAQFSMWTGSSAPKGLFDRLVREALTAPRST